MLYLHIPLRSHMKEVVQLTKASMSAPLSSFIFFLSFLV